MRRIVLLIVAASLLLPPACAKKEEDVGGLVVAEVGSKKITVADIERADKNIDEEYLPAKDDLEGKKELLNHIINKEVITFKARAAGYEREEWFVQFWESFKPHFLIAEMMQYEVRDKIEVSEEEVDDYYEKMHYEYTISQIILANMDDALEIRERIMEGEDFAEMARKYSIGPAADRGGFIGSNTIGSMHYWVEEALFEMEEGDISEPLRAAEGAIALVRLERKREIVPARDREYARRRIHGIKEKKGIEAHKLKVEKDIGLTFFPEAITIAYESLPEDIPMGDIVSGKVTHRNAPKVQIPEQYKDMVICKYVDGEYTLGDFELIYESIGLPGRPRRMHGKAGVRDAVHKRLFEEVLPLYAENQLKILEIPQVREDMEKRKDEFLVNYLYQDQIAKEVNVSNKEAEDFYHEHINELTTFEKRDFSIILVGKEDEARMIMNLAKEGEDFSVLVGKYSKDPRSKENLGRTGLVKRGQYHEYDDVAFSLPNVGDISEPFKVARGWALVKLEEIEVARTPTFREAKAAVRQRIKKEREDELFNRKIKRWREDYIINIYEDNLDKVRLTRTKG